MALNKIKEWQLDLTETHKKINSIGKAVNFKGRVDSFNLLPTTGQDGDLWYVGPIDKENKEEYVWYDGKWELLGSSGALDIATTEEAKEGFDDSKVMTPLKTAQAIYANLGRVIQLGFNGTLTGNVLTFEPDIEGGYEIRNGYSYEIDLLFPAVVADGSLDENIEMVISNNGQTIKIVNALNDDITNNITVGDMKQIMKYTTDIGFRWIFNARFATAQSGEKVFVIPSTVSNVGDGGVAEAVENQNEEKTTSPKVYTWVGTKAEYEEQKIATEHPDWLAYITDDFEDSDCFNQHNFFAGEGLEIVPFVPEGGNDEHTTFLLDCDNEIADSSSNQIKITTATGTAEYSASVNNFGEALCYKNGSLGFAHGKAFNFGTGDFTIDFWAKMSSDEDCNGDIYFSDGSNTYGFEFGGGMVDIGLPTDSGTFAPRSVPVGIFNFFTLDRKNGIMTFFINGNPQESLPATGSYSFTSINFMCSGSNPVCFDEIRVSNVSRYGSEAFEVPTIPYFVPHTEIDKFQINLTGGRKAIGEVFYSQSSKSIDNPGSLPLFTGETITSANTIYPDFYTWVESHAELQATAEEYETALTTYGECPKYVVSNGSLRLPKLSNYIKMANTTDGITQSEAGLPNITGTFSAGASYNESTGAFTKANGANHGGHEDWASQTIHTLDASLSSEVYGKSDTVTPAHTTLYPWVYAFSAAIPTSTAQAAEFQEGLSGKADANLGNIPTNIDYVVEEVTDGNGNWARVWKSGKLEAGGYTPTTTVSQVNEVITFLRPFADTNYVFVTTTFSAGAVDSRYYVEKKDARTETGVTILFSHPRSWYAVGKGAEL